MASRTPELAARDEGHAGQPLGFGAQRGLAKRREPVVNTARVLSVALGNQARLDHAVERAVQRSRPHFDRTLRVRLDLLHNVIAMPLLAEEGQQDMDYAATLTLLVRD